MSATYYASFDVAPYAMKNAMLRSTYVSYVGFAEKKGKEKICPNQESSFFFLSYTT
jgi:hypothetical protein